MKNTDGQGFVIDMSEGMKTNHKYMLNIGISFVVWIGGAILTANVSYRDPSYELYEIAMIGGALYFFATVFLGLVNHGIRPIIRHFSLTRKKNKAHEEARLCQKLYETGFLDEESYCVKSEELKIYIMQKTL